MAAHAAVDSGECAAKGCMVAVCNNRSGAPHLPGTACTSRDFLSEDSIEVTNQPLAANKLKAAIDCFGCSDAGSRASLAVGPS